MPARGLQSWLLFSEHMNGSYSEGSTPSTTDLFSGSPRRIHAPNPESNRDSAQQTISATAKP
jgi:hypothetical protein